MVSLKRQFLAYLRSYYGGPSTPELLPPPQQEVIFPAYSSGSLGEGGVPAGVGSGDVVAARDALNSVLGS